MITVRPRVKSSLLWGIVGLLAFLSLAQGYDLLVARLPVDLLARFAVALVVGAAVAGLAYATEHRLARKGRT